jgi:hypothetical protein
MANTPGQLTHMAESALKPIIAMCASPASPAGTKNAAMRANLLELSSYLQTLAAQLAAQAATL